MPRLSAQLRPGKRDAAFSDYYRNASQRLERAALIATDRGQEIAVANIRQAIAGAGLGRLGNAIGGSSDKAVHRTIGERFSATGTVFIRGRSPRTRGAIEAYTEGANIRPVRGRWLWIPSSEIMLVAGTRNRKERVSPSNWERLGLNRKIGPLVPVKSVNGYPLLVVEKAGSAADGRARSARSRTKSGAARKGQRARELIVAFIAIPSTSRQARVGASAIIRSVQTQLPALFASAMGRS